MKKAKRHWRKAIPIVLLLLPVLAITAKVSHQTRQDHLDQSLVAAVKRLDSSEVVELLNQGADANATEQKPKTLLQTIRHVLTHWQNNHENKPPSKPELRVLAITFSPNDNLPRRHPSPKELSAMETITNALLEHGAQIQLDDKGMDPLPYAVILHWHKTVRTLVEKGANVNPHLPDDVSLLVGADPEDALTLVNHGANVNAKDHLKGWTPLYWMILVHNVDTMQVLLEHGADVRMVDEEGVPNLFYTKPEPPGSKVVDRMIELLRQHGAKLGFLDKKDQRSWWLNHGAAGVMDSGRR